MISTHKPKFYFSLDKQSCLIKYLGIVFCLPKYLIESFPYIATDSDGEIYLYGKDPILYGHYISDVNMISGHWSSSASNIYIGTMQTTKVFNLEREDYEAAYLEYATSSMPVYDLIFKLL